MIKDKLKIIFKKDKKSLAKKGIEQVQESIEEIEEGETIDVAIETAYESFQKYTKRMTPEQKGEFVQEFAKLLLKNIKVEKSEEIAAEFINTMLEDDEVPDSYVLNSAKELPDEKLTEFTEKGSIPIKYRKELVKSMNDEVMKQEQLDKLQREEERKVKAQRQKELESLQKIYAKCNDQVSDNELINQVNSATKNIKYLTSQEIDEMKIKIVARKIAYNFSKFGTSNMAFLVNIISAADMKKLGIIELSQKEYTLIKKDKRKKEFDKEKLDEIIQKKINDKDEEYNEENEIEKIKKKLRKIPLEKRKKLIQEINHFITDSKKRKIFETMEQEGVLELLEIIDKMPKEEIVELIQNLKRTSKRKEDIDAR